MRKTLKIIIAQINFLVGDMHHNAKKIINVAKIAHDELKGDVVIFPELALTSYPPEDLLLRKDFLQQTAEALALIAREVTNIDLIVGYPEPSADGLLNAAAVIQQGKIVATYYKQHLPNYGVFDEKRYFLTGHAPCVVNIKDIPIAITICEDMWYPDPMAQAVAAGARMVFSLNASPYDFEKPALREKVLQQRVNEGGIPIVYVHGIGAQDELVFDGGSMVLDAQGKICAHAGFFTEQLLPVTVNVDEEITFSAPPLPPTLSTEASIYEALVLGVRDYVEKNKFPGVILGLSGGIDSALTLAIAVDALGNDRVQAAFMPSRYTSSLSAEVVKSQADAMGVLLHNISIETTYQAFLDSLANTFAGKPLDQTEENLQARCRGTLLMAISNKTNYLVLTTGNKSEMAVGYATLYGDMAGGFAVLKDVYKTWVYRLANYRNTINAIIPQQVIDRAPSAELAPNQTDQDTLPPYPVLDKILNLYIEADNTIPDIIAQGCDEATVRKVLALVKRNEYKRRQAPPGVKITPRAFGRDRRYPITSGFEPK